MSNYSKATNFTAKDATNAIITGVDFDSEFTAVATASATKADKAVPATANSVAGLNSTGNLYDTTITTAQLTTAVNNASLTGEIKMWPSNTPPSGWLLCDGTSYATASYSDLFAVLSYNYGGSGANFNVPDMRGRVPLGQDDMGGTSANRVTAAAADSLGGSGGAETHTLSSSEMPAHTHSGTTNSDGNHRHSGSYLGSASTGASGDNKQVKNVSGYTDYDGTHTHSFTTGSTGGGGAHNNMQPYVVVNYIIKT